MKTEIFNLKHGAKVLFNKQTEVQGISVQFNFTAGALNDKKGKLGIAHFCEHAICDFPNAKMTRDEKISYRRKYTYINAFTSFKEVCFVVRMTEEDFEDAIDFLTESFSSLKFLPEEFEKEKRIINDEIKTRVKVNGAIYGATVRREIVKDEHYKNLIYSPAGTEETLEKITLDDLKEFITNYFTLNNLHVSISGNISKKRVINAMHKFVERRIGVSDSQGFMSRNVNDLYLPKYHYKPAVENGKALISCIYNIKHIPWSYEIDREWIVSGILTPILQEYVMRYYRHQNNLCYSCMLSVYGVSNHLSSEFCLECQEENLEEVINLYESFLKELPENIDKELFEKHKRKKLLSYNFDFIGISKICDIIYDVYLNENKLYNDSYKKRVFAERKSVTYDEVNNLYKTLFKVKPHVIIVANDEKYKDFNYKEFCKKARLK